MRLYLCSGITRCFSSQWLIAQTVESRLTSLSYLADFLCVPVSGVGQLRKKLVVCKCVSAGCLFIFLWISCFWISTPWWDFREAATYFIKILKVNDNYVIMKDNKTKCWVLVFTLQVFYFAFIHLDAKCENITHNFFRPKNYITNYFNFLLKLNNFKI